MITKVNLLELVKKSDLQLTDGIQLYVVQNELRKFEHDIDGMPLSERFEMACYAKRKADAITALIHCKGIIADMIDAEQKKLI